MTATSTPPQPAPQSEEELLAREAAAAREAIAAVWQQLLAEVKSCPQEAVAQHPWGAMLASASAGALVGAGAAACARDRVEQEADKRCPPRDPKRKRQQRRPVQAVNGAAHRHDPRGAHEHQIKSLARAATGQAATALLTNTLLQAAPAFIMGFMGAGAPQHPGDAPA